MKAIAWLLRAFCYLFHTILSLALLALGTVAILSGANHLKLETLPWHGPELNYWLAGLGIAGLLSVLLAVTGTLRFLLPLWSVYVLGMQVKGVLLSPAVSFDGPADFHNWLWLIGGAVLALAGSFTLLGRRRA
ncbi:MAG: hypothetical protein ABSF22_00090 [Bryobacteraceae bacterium]|jgi:hypothetical protein